MNKPGRKQSIAALAYPVRENGKTVVPKLPANWVNWFFARQLQTTSNQKGKNIGQSLLALAFLISAGVTPGELEQGIRIKVLSIDELAILIGNSSDPKKRDLKTRVLVFNIKHRMNDAVDYLINSFCQAEKVGVVYDFSYKQNRLSKLIRALSQEFIAEKIPRKSRDHIQISSATFRHELCANLCKSDQYEAVEVANILGLAHVSNLRRYALESNTPVPPQQMIKYHPLKTTQTKGGV